MGRVRLKSSLVLHDVLFVQGFTCKLISFRCLMTKMNCIFMAFRDCCILQGSTSKKLIGVGDLRGGVYQWRHVSPTSVASLTMSQSHAFWHQRLGHASHSVLHLVPWTSLKKLDYAPCDRCLQSIQTHIPCSTSEGSATTCFFFSFAL